MEDYSWHISEDLDDLKLLQMNTYTREGYEDWLEENHKELNTRAAEAGLDNEDAFDLYEWAEGLYLVHCCHNE